MGSPLLLSQDELDTYFSLGGRNGPVEKINRRDSNRSPYPIMQPLAPYGEWGLPKLEMFRRVRCHDLSCGGVSFFLPEPADFRFAAIGLGQSENYVYYLIRVLHCKEIVGDPKVYLVGSSFIQKVATPQ